MCAYSVTHDYNLDMGGPGFGQFAPYRMAGEKKKYWSIFLISFLRPEDSCCSSDKCCLELGFALLSAYVVSRLRRANIAKVEKLYMGNTAVLTQFS